MGFSEFLRLYPHANLLVTPERTFEANRKKFCARIATGDYDAVIMGTASLNDPLVRNERQERLIQEQDWMKSRGHQRGESQAGEHFTVKQLEKTRKSLETKLEKLHAEGRKDDVVTFEQLGVDRLFVDESQLRLKTCFCTRKCVMSQVYPPPRHRNPAICSASAAIWTRSPAAVA